MAAFPNWCPKGAENREGPSGRPSCQADNDGLVDLLQGTVLQLRQLSLQNEMLNNENVYLKQMLQEYIRHCRCGGDLHPCHATGAGSLFAHQHAASPPLCCGTAAAEQGAQRTTSSLTDCVNSVVPHPTEPPPEAHPSTVSAMWLSPTAVGFVEEIPGGPFPAPQWPKKETLQDTPPLLRSSRRPFLPHMTTIVVRNIPARYSQALLMEMWPQHTYAYDSFYLPYKDTEKRGAGFVIINFVTHAAAAYFWQVVSGVKMPNCGHLKGLDVAVADLQGFQKNTAPYSRGKTFDQVQKETLGKPAIFTGTTPLSFMQLLLYESTPLRL
ncbi:unnamed protein product, partial [Polarella glacialis]